MSPQLLQPTQFRWRPWLGALVLPTDVKISGALTPDTTVSRQAVPNAAGYRIYWRSTDTPQWQHSVYVGNVASCVLKDRVISDWYFGVASVSKDGYENPVVFPSPAGAF